MAVKAAAKFAGIKLPLVEAALPIPVFGVGDLIMGGVRLPAASVPAAAGLFAVFHSHAHGLEVRAAAVGGYMLGVLAAEALSTWPWLEARWS